MGTPTKHQPAPWQSTTNGLMMDKYGSPIRQTDWNGTQATQTEIANARLIVLAVNSHAALVEAARELFATPNIHIHYDGKRYYDPAEGWAYCDCEQAKALRRLEAAVALAEGGNSNG